MTDQPETDEQREQREDREETERDHAAGNHQHCGVTCEVEMPSEMLRNFILAKGYPGTAGALDELLRRAALTPPTDQSASDSLRELYAAAIDAKVDGTEGCANGHRLADAALGVRDQEMEQLRARAERADRQRDQYASAIQQLILQVKQTAYVWSQTLPDTIRTADVTKALMWLCSPAPVPDGLRNDTWQRIVGAYYLRFESDGHPEDSEAAADVAMDIIRPELEELTARAEQAEAAIERVRKLHQPAPGGSGGLSFNSGERCAGCDGMYRCDTIRTLDQPQQPTTTEAS